MISDVGDARRIYLGQHFREFDPRMGLECLPKVAAAIAHQFHLAPVFDDVGAVEGWISLRYFSR